MKLSTSLVAIKKISCSQPRSIFTDNDLEEAAKLILESQGVINPIVVRRTSLQSYEVVDGGFEYYAAARAREIDPRKGEMIGVFIIEPENEEALIKQVQLFRKSKDISENNIEFKSDSQESTNFSNMEPRMTNIESRVTNIETRFENRISQLQAEFKNEFKNISGKINEIESLIPKPIEPLEALNTLSLSELTAKLRRVNVKPKIIESIVNERKKGKFKSFSNVVERIEGLGDKTMLKIIDSFTEGTI